MDPVAEELVMYGAPAEVHDLEWPWVAEQLASTGAYWAVTPSSERPHPRPVWGVWMPERERFGFSCAPTARKVRNIAANPQVVVTNDDATRVVSREGRAEPLGDATLRPMAERWAAKYGDEPDMGDTEEMIEFLRQNTAFEVVPERAFGMIETPEEFGPAATKWIWDQGD